MRAIEAARPPQDSWQQQHHDQHTYMKDAACASLILPSSFNLIKVLHHAWTARRHLEGSKGMSILEGAKALLPGPVLHMMTAPVVLLVGLEGSLAPIGISFSWLLASPLLVVSWSCEA